MRLCGQNLRSEIALLSLWIVFCAGPSQAFFLTLDTTYDGNPLLLDEEVSVDVLLLADDPLLLISVGVVYDPTILEFQPVGSSAQSYLLYSAASQTWMNPDAGTLTVWQGGGPSRVMLGFSAESFVPTTATSPSEWMGTINFKVIGEGQTDLHLQADAWSPSVFCPDVEGETCPRSSSPIAIQAGAPDVPVSTPLALLILAGALAGPVLVGSRSRTR